MHDDNDISDHGKKDEKHVNKDENSFEYYQYDGRNDDSNVNNLFTIPGYR